jgi:AraC-like DNA-binding protein
VTSVALDLGYDSPSAFSAMFHRALGSTPRRYLQRGTTMSSASSRQETP